jgi:Protein involved in formate dehydrogenase formation
VKLERHSFIELMGRRADGINARRYLLASAGKAHATSAWLFKFAATTEMRNRRHGTVSPRHRLYHVRAVCITCWDGHSVVLRAIDGHADAVKAETCDRCGTYAKVLYRTCNAELAAGSAKARKFTTHFSSVMRSDGDTDPALDVISVAVEIWTEADPISPRTIVAAQAPRLQDQLGIEPLHALRLAGKDRLNKLPFGMAEGVAHVRSAFSQLESRDLAEPQDSSRTSAT